MRWRAARRQGRLHHRFVAALRFGKGAALPYNAGSNQGPVMRHALVAVFAAAFLAIAPGWAQTPSPIAAAPPPAENLAAARELVQVMKATDQFKALLPSIFAALKPAFVQGRPDMEKDYDAVMPIVIDGAMQRLNEFADMLAAVYARNFSVDEIHDLTAFYRTPTGQKLIERQSVIGRESLAAGQQFGQELVLDLKQQINDELSKREHAN